MRAPANVLVLPYARLSPGAEPRYAVFHRSDAPGCWQGIAGGIEGAETPEEAARREAWEEARIPPTAELVTLDARAMVPAAAFAAARDWGSEVYVIPEHAFGIAAQPDAVVLSHEHREFAWLAYAEAIERVTSDSNRVALWELHVRLLGLRAGDAAAAELLTWP